MDPFIPFYITADYVKSPGTIGPFACVISTDNKLTWVDMFCRYIEPFFAIAWPICNGIRFLQVEIRLQVCVY